MGIYSQPSYEVNNNSSYLWSKVLDAQTKKVKVTKKRVKRRTLMKRRRGSYGIQRRVRTLKRLIPNSDESIGLDGLFRETANYILSLQNRVSVMKVMVDVLTGSDE
ncbi:putative transcription factor bHLH family [Medicago truncatula]|uniref:Putative transcription factor bHLH family n=1 Tax=Medicago truncatula TaxID=3880 RepID=A0A072VQ70_MEDTR|nr:hypothetical protein MTR_1g096530 [Medicago truncatula]RHN81571.1 putative transcription factor bHLH family [Medicago truncatula]